MANRHRSESGSLARLDRLCAPGHSTARRNDPGEHPLRAGRSTKTLLRQVSQSRNWIDSSTMTRRRLPNLDRGTRHPSSAAAKATHRPGPCALPSAGNPHLRRSHQRPRPSHRDAPCSAPCKPGVPGSPSSPWLIVRPPSGRPIDHSSFGAGPDRRQRNASPNSNASEPLFRNLVQTTDAA